VKAAWFGDLQPFDLYKEISWFLNVRCVKFDLCAATSRRHGT
jgi:hypothetical protein